MNEDEAARNANAVILGMIEGGRGDDVRRMVREFLACRVRELLRPGQKPRLLLDIDGVPVYDTDFTAGDDLRGVIAHRVMGDPALLARFRATTPPALGVTVDGVEVPLQDILPGVED